MLFVPLFLIPFLLQMLIILLQNKFLDHGNTLVRNPKDLYGKKHPYNGYFFLFIQNFSSEFKSSLSPPKKNTKCVTNI